MAEDPSVEAACADRVSGGVGVPGQVVNVAIASSRSTTRPGAALIAWSAVGRRRTVTTVRVTFRKLIEKRVTTWDAVRGARTHVPGTTMALGRADLPHDLVQMIVEGALGITDGFWGSIAAGATFKSTGRKPTRPGRAVIVANRDSIRVAEHIVGEHYRRWREGEPTPAARHFHDLASQWADLGDGEGLTVDWPTLRLMSEPV